MAENSAIEWTDHTFNPWEGCQKVGPGCDHCYAEARNARFGGGVAVNWGPGAPRRRTSEYNWKKPIHWNANHDSFFAKYGRRQRVFCASLADVFDNQVDPQWRRDLWDLIEATPNIDWLLLTKRVSVAVTWIAMFGLPKNIWLGISVVNQEEADRDIPKLLQVPATVRFLSMEPLLGPVDLRLLRPARDDDRQDLDGYCYHITTAAGAGIKWVIVGGESGRSARPMHPDWVRSLRDQCAAAAVPFLFKQWGEWLAAIDGRSILGRTLILEGQAPFKDNPEWHHFSDGKHSARIGKKAAGRLLDGVQHDGYPEVKP